MSWKVIIQGIRRPSRLRQAAIVGVLVIMVAVCLALVLKSEQSEVLVALEIFLVSVSGFSLIAWISFDAYLAWRFVDFPWICTSFAAIIVALLNISETGHRQQVSLAKSEISRGFSDLIYATQRAVTNDCQELPTRQGMWEPSPEPYDGACDRMKHFLPQMTYQYDEFSRSLDLSGLRSWAMNMLVQDARPTGSWDRLFDSARRFLATSELFGSLLSQPRTSQNDDKTDVLRHFILSTQLRYWYFAMAFFVGLRLSKTTAEVFQARAARGK
jgi:hypothetical protein